MSDAEREAWDRRYADGTYVPRSEHSAFLASWLEHIPAGRALDVAAGTGRNARLLARAGFDVTAVDISPVAVAQGQRLDAEAGLDVDWRIQDLDDLAVPPDTFALVSVIRFRNPTLWPVLRRALAPGGWIVVEHHLVTHLDAGGPPTNDFRLRPGELLEAFADLRIVHYGESVEPADLGRDDRARPFVTARFVACNGDPGW